MWQVFRGSRHLPGARSARRGQSPSPLTVTFRVTDTDPAVVLPLDYTFTAGDQGRHTFTGAFTLITPGDQTLTVAHMANGLSIDVTLTVNA